MHSQGAEAFRESTQLLAAGTSISARLIPRPRSALYLLSRREP
jgi:hypothetical protein